jgi:hypothetical protein
VETVLKILAFLGLLGLVTWLCEKYRPAIVLGGIVVLIVALT